jgi:enamine deaminase RidA (YjgF/YER057c/UK114 family)
MSPHGSPHDDRAQPGETRSGSAHEIAVAPELAAPVGYAHAVVAAPGRIVALGGQTALAGDGRIAGATLVEQFDVAAGNVVCALRAAGCSPDDLVAMQVFVTDVGEYRRVLRELGPVWRRHFGRRYPALGLFGVTGLFDEDAVVELMGLAVRPEEPAR